MGCRPSKEKNAAETSAECTSNPKQDGPTDGSTEEKHKTTKHKKEGKPFMSVEDRTEVKQILDDHFKVDTNFVVHFSHVKAKMHQKLVEAREKLSIHGSGNNNDDSDSSHYRQHHAKSPRISFSVYSEEHAQKQSREDKISKGIVLILERLQHLHLDQVVMDDDGNCQFRSLAHQFYGNADDFHEQVRHTCVSYLRKHAEQFFIYFESPSEWERYLATMSKSGTWGDELTLKAASNALHCNVHVFTSEDENYYLCYIPDDDEQGGGGDEPAVDLFLAYISPIHYNSLVLCK